MEGAMKKLVLALILLATPSYAQWQVPDHAVPIGNGAGVTGFNSAPPVANGILWAPNTTTDPSFTASPIIGTSLQIGNDGLGDGAIFRFKSVTDAAIFSSVTTGTGAHNFPQFQLRSRDNVTPNGAGPVIAFISPNSVGTFKTGVQLNGGMVDATAGAEQGDIDFVILRNGVDAIPLALRGDLSALVPSVTDSWDIGTGALRYRTIRTSRNVDVGLAGTSNGFVNFNGTTSGTVSVTAQAVAGAPTLTLPNTTGTFAISAGASAPLSINTTTGALGFSGMTSNGIWYASSATATASDRCTMDSNQTISCTSANANQPQYSITTTGANANGALFIFNKNRSGGNTNSADALGSLLWQGFANGGQQNTASVQATQSAAASGSNIPSNIVFSASNTSGQLNVQWTFNGATGDVTLPGAVVTAVSTVAGLPTCNAGSKGARRFVTDSNATTFHNTVAGGGANNVGVTCDGTNWYIS